MSSRLDNRRNHLFFYCFNKTKAKYSDNILQGQKLVIIQLHDNSQSEYVYLFIYVYVYKSAKHE